MDLESFWSLFVEDWDCIAHVLLDGDNLFPDWQVR